MITAKAVRSILTALMFASVVARAAEHRIKPGDDPQTVLDAVAAGDKLVFLPGLHQHKLGKHRAILSVEKSIHIELMAGATLKLADDECRPTTAGEITTDQDAGDGKLDDLQVGGEFDRLQNPTEGAELYGATVYTLIIEKASQGPDADTFRWGDGKLFDTPHRGIPITGDWQELSHGVKIRFPNRTGHAPGSLWFVSYGGPEAYGIRIGHGLQNDSIEDVVISGGGTIDLNSSRNAQPSGLVKNINACVLIHGRVRNVRVEGITMTNTMRSVMCYGEHTGKLLPGGKTGEGESFDAQGITILRTRTLNPKGSGYLLGHPSHRGLLRDVKCNQNYMETGMNAIEPNFNLDGYEVIGNVIKSDGQAIHCWRHSKGGVVADNLRIHDNTGKPVVVSSPRGWQAPAPPVQRNNRNHLVESASGSPSIGIPIGVGRVGRVGLRECSANPKPRSGGGEGGEGGRFERVANPGPGDESTEGAHRPDPGSQPRGRWDRLTLGSPNERPPCGGRGGQIGVGWRPIRAATGA